MHGGQALWNLYVLVCERTTNAQNDPVLGVAMESCKVLSDLIKVPLPDQTVLAHLLKQNEILRGGAPATAPAAKPQARGVTGLAHAALDHCGYILDHVDDVPEKGEEFAESLRAKATSMKETITKLGTATDKQISALENMRAGLDRWLHK